MYHQYIFNSFKLIMIVNVHEKLVQEWLLYRQTNIFAKFTGMFSNQNNFYMQRSSKNNDFLAVCNQNYVCMFISKCSESIIMI